MLVIFVILIVLFYRNITRNIIQANITDIRIIKMHTPLNGSIDEKLKIDIEKDISNYVYIIFGVETKNLSNNYNISNISIDPIIPQELKEKVFWFDKSGDAPTDSVMRLGPTEDKKFGRQLIVRRDNLNDDQLIDLFKTVKFNISYISFNNKNQFIKYLSMGYSKSISN